MYIPPPPPLPPAPTRKPWTIRCTGQCQCNPQTQSAFFTTLPPEIRHEIYRHAFDSGTASTPQHPLTPLLTCHRLNHEANKIAFSTHAFAVSHNLRNSTSETFVTLRHKIVHLSAQQIFAITALSYDLGQEYRELASEVPYVLAYGILVFVSLSRFELRIQRDDEHDCDEYAPQDDAVEKYAPYWFHNDIMRSVAMGILFQAKTGEKWRVRGENWKVGWPQLDSAYLSLTDGEYSAGQMPHMGIEAVGAVRGVHLCACGCGNVCWLAADLVQETGRRVRVDTALYGEDV